MKQSIVHTINDSFGADRFLAPLLRRLREDFLNISLIIGSDGDFYVIQPNLPVRAVRLKLALTLNPLAFLTRVYKVYRYLIAEDAGVIHCHMTKVSLVPLLAAKLARVPVRIYHNHGFPFLGYTGVIRFALLMLEKLLFALSTKVICVSQSNRDEASKVGLIRDPGKTVVVGHGSAVGVAPEKFASVDRQQVLAYKTQLGFSADTVLVGYVGRPVRRKGFHLLLEVWTEFEHKSPGKAALLVAGCTVEDCRKVLGKVPEDIRALGLVDDLRLFYNACDLIVLPSFHEGLGNALIEGGMSGCALIGTNIPGIRDTIDGESNGLLVPLGSKKHLKDALRSLIDDPQKRRTMGIHSREKMLREFDQDALLKGYIELYRNIQIEVGLV